MANPGKKPTKERQAVTRLAKQIKKQPDFILADDFSYEFRDRKLRYTKGRVRIGHLPTLRYLVIPTHSLPLPRDFFRRSTKSLEDRSNDSYKLFQIAD